MLAGMNRGQQPKVTSGVAGAKSATKSAPLFNSEIHAPVRLRICGLLVGAKEVSFATIRDDLQLADSVVSKHISRLESAGYVTVSKRAKSTWIALSAAGRKAFARHIAALEQIAGLRN